MGPSPEVIAGLLGLLYEAASSEAPEAWPAFLAAVGRAASADRTYFVLEDPDHKCNFSLQIGFDPAWQAAYAEHFHQHDPLFASIMAAQQRHGEWAGTTASLMQESALRRSYFWNEFFRHQAVPKWSWAAIALRQSAGGLEGGLGLQRTAGRAPIGRSEVALLKMLSPHLRRALDTYRATATLRDHCAELRNGLEALEGAVISLGADGRVLRSTPAAEAILARQDGLRLECGCLRAMVPAERDRLQSLIAAAASVWSQAPASASARPVSSRCAPEVGSNPVWTPAPAGGVLISRRQPLRPLQVTVAPVRFGGPVRMDCLAAALVFISDPEAAPQSRQRALRSLFGLTPAEARITGLLAGGNELGAIAAQLHITQGTARFHLKAIFRKTGTSRQSELVRLVLRLPGDC